MATKKDGFFSSLKDKNFVDNFTDNNSDNKYLNINLNQNFKCLNVLSVKSDKTSKSLKNDKKFVSFGIDNYEEKSWNNPNFVDSASKMLNGYFDEIKEVKNPWNYANFTNKNSSTLSLYIAAYENSDVDKNEGLEVEKSELIKKWKNSKQLFSRSSPNQNPFEIPRQQRNDNLIKPEMMQFKASQRLYNPNAPTSSSFNFQQQGQKRRGRNSNRSGGGGRNEISKKSVYQLAFPKNTCVLRFADLNSQNIADTIWLIENHILIRKLELEGPIAGGKPTFFRFTNRYQGWFYDEPWDFMPLTAVSNTSSKSVDGALTILFPTVEMIEKGYEIAQRQRLQQRISHSSEMSAREQLEQKVQQLKAIKSRRKKGKKNNNNNNNDNDNEEEEEEEGNENEENGENEMMEEEDEDECLIDEEATLSSPQGISAEMFDVDD